MPLRFNITYGNNITHVKVASCKEPWCVAALERSGHHAVINWLLKQKGKPSVHVDTYIKEDEVGTCCAGVYEYDGNGNLRDLRDSSKEVEILNADRLVLSVENTLPDEELGKPFIIMRTYPNWAASYYTMFKSIKKLQRMSALWETLVEENVYTIWYDSWYASENYRKKLCRDLGLGFTDEGFTDISPTGGGSSFDDMNVLNRWQRLRNDAAFMEVLRENADL